MGVETAIEIHPFQVGIPEDELAGCNAGSRRRAGLLKSSCRPLPGGVQLATLQALARYWTSEYDWRK